MVDLFESASSVDSYFPSMSPDDLVLDPSGQSNSGKSGSSARLHERFACPQIPEATLEKYFRGVSGERLHYTPETVPYIDGKELFGIDGALIWDFGCGRGEYIINSAKQNPDEQYVGVDLHHASLMLGVKAAAAACLDNVRFIRADCNLLVSRIPSHSGKAASVLFPATFRKGQVFKGMPSPELAAQIHRILQDVGSQFEFATDSEPFFNYRMRQLGELGLFSLSQDELVIGGRSVNLPTRYQKVWESKDIPTRSAVLRKK
jgi:tRNA G46 methylase TrmB